MKILLTLLSLSCLVPTGSPKYGWETPSDTLVQAVFHAADSGATQLTLNDALKIALSENVAVKVADREITRTKYAKKGTYAALYPQIDGSAAYQRTIKKQVMYMDVSAPGMEFPEEGMEVGRWNTLSAGLNLAMPVVNAQLWESLKISKDEVELAVEKARNSRLEMVTQVKDAYYGVLLAKQAALVYEQMYDNAKRNLDIAQKKYNAQRTSEMDLVRAKTNLANTIPNVYSSRNDIDLALWRLKAVMGVDLTENIDVAESLESYGKDMVFDLYEKEEIDLSRNSTMKQLAYQVGELAKTIKMHKYAYIPTLSLAFTYSINAYDNTFNFSQYHWSPYSYVGLQLNIPIFSGMKRQSNVQMTKVQYDQLQLQRQQTERDLKIAIGSDLSTMETAVNSYYAALSALESAQKAYDIAVKSYEVGRSTLVELNASQLSLTEAQLLTLQAIHSFLVSKADLEKQLGLDYEFN